MIARSTNTCSSGRRAGPYRAAHRVAGRALVPWILGAVGLLVVAGLALAASAARSIPISVRIEAVDASGAPVTAKVFVDGKFIGEAPLELDRYWDFGASDLDEATGPLDESVPPGAVRFFGLDTTVGDAELTTVHLIQPDGAVDTTLRAERGGRAAVGTLRLEVGEPGALLRPVKALREGGVKGFLGKTRYTLRLEFAPAP